MGILSTNVLVLLLIIISPVAAIYYWYATIISRRNTACEAWSSIDVQLKKRHDLIPNILTIAQKFMDHESRLLEQITTLRSQVLKDSDAAGTEELSKRLLSEGQLGGLMGKLLVAVENYPDLKSNSNMIEAQRTYTEVENNISAARRFYNTAAKQLNNAVQIFPGNLIAEQIDIEAMPFFEAERTDKRTVDAKKYLT